MTTVNMHCFSSHSPSFSEVASGFSFFRKFLSFFLLLNSSKRRCQGLFFGFSPRRFRDFPASAWLDAYAGLRMDTAFLPATCFVPCLFRFARSIVSQRRKKAPSLGCSGDCLLQQRKPAPFHLPKKSRNQKERDFLPSKKDLRTLLFRIFPLIIIAIDFFSNSTINLSLPCIMLLCQKRG